MELYGLKKISPSCTDLHEACPYTLHQLLQKGKNSVRILKASSPDSNETVAIKLFPKTKQNQITPPFLNEQRSVTGLSHKHILTYHETYSDAMIQTEPGKFAEYSAIVMEYVSHGDLYGIISKKSCPEKLARTIFKQVVSAISYLHSKELAHLDLKLENFLIDPKQGIKLIDFETCQATGQKCKVFAKGTPGYRAPEAIQDRCDNLKALDIYSLGVVLFTLVAGTPPYTEEQKGGAWVFDRYYDALRNDTKKFWGAHEKYRKAENKENFSVEFKESVESMLGLNPQERPSIEEVRRSKWYQGEVYSNEELERQLNQYFKM